MQVFATRLAFADGHQTIKCWCYPKLSRKRAEQKAREQLREQGFKPTTDRGFVFRWMNVPGATIEDALGYVGERWGEVLKRRAN